MARVVELLAEIAVHAVRAPGPVASERNHDTGLVAVANGHAVLMQVIEVQPQPGPVSMGVAQPVGIWLQQAGVPGATPCHLWLTVAAGEPLPFQAGQTCLLTLTAPRS